MCLVAQCTRCTGSPLSKIYIGNQILAIKTLDKSTKKDKEIPVERSVPWYKILYQEIREGCVVRTDLKLCQLAPCMLVRVTFVPIPVPGASVVYRDLTLQVAQ
jgi:hypothetical protein